MVKVPTPGAAASESSKSTDSSSAPAKETPAPKAAASKATPAPKTPAAPARPTLADETDLVRIMYYGDPGLGKTTAMAHMAKLGKVIYIDAENRLKPGPLKRLGVPIENIEPYKTISYDELTELALSIRERLDSGEKIVGVCWDSVTETSQALLSQVVDVGVRRAEIAGKERDAWSTQLQDYGDMTGQMRRLVRSFRDLPIHLACSCLPNRDTDEEGSIRVSPALTPAVLRDFMGYMDLVLHVRMELVGGVEEYSALTKPYGRWVAKDSFGVFPRVLVNPTFDRVMGYVSGDLILEDDEVQQAAKAARQAAAPPAN